MIPTLHFTVRDCSVCGETKSATAFRSQREGEGLRSVVCRRCENADKQLTIKNDPDRLEAERIRKRDYMRRKAAEHRMKSEPISLNWRCDGVLDYGLEYSAEWRGIASLRVFKVRGNNRYYYIVTWESGQIYDSRQTELGDTAPHIAQQAASNYLETQCKRMSK